MRATLRGGAIAKAGCEDSGHRELGCPFWAGGDPGGALAPRDLILGGLGQYRYFLRTPKLPWMSVLKRVQQDKVTDPLATGLSKRQQAAFYRAQSSTHSNNE